MRSLKDVMAVFHGVGRLMVEHGFPWLVSCLFSFVREHIWSAVVNRVSSAHAC